MIYDYTIYPLECVYKIMYLCFYSLLDSYGLALVFLSAFTCCVTHPLMSWACNISRAEKEVQKYIKPQLDKIKVELSGAEQHHAIQRLYKRYSYHPVMAVRSAIGVMLQLPFLMAAYYMLSNLDAIKGISWLVFKDLGQPDALVAGFNVMPFVMTIVNLLSAYTTAGFTKRDKLQAFAIAGMFLLLLYNAPSALLIYWTFNNLYTLLGNLFAKHQIKVPSIKFKGKGIIYWVSNFPEHIYVLLTLAFTGAMFIPMDIYLSNINEFWFGLSKIFPWFLLWSFVAFVIFLTLYALLRDEFRIIFITLTVGALLGVVVQSYFINLDYGVLNGTAIDWKKYKTEGIINSLIWMICFAIPVFCCWKLKYQKFLKVAAKFCVVLVVVQVASLFYVHTKHPEDKRYNCILTMEKMFEISSKENIIIFVLDKFDNKIFNEILEKESWVKSEFEGFTYYPDATSVYGDTGLALPHILTGIKYRNNMLVKQYIDEAWKNTLFYSEMQKNNYNICAYTFKNFVTPATGDILSNLKELSDLKINSKVRKNFIKLTLFRLAPHFIKKRFWIYAGEFYNVKTKDAYVIDDMLFHNELNKGLAVTDQYNVFKLYHLNGPHPPYTIRRDLKKGVSDEYNQAVASLKIVINYINKMKKANAFKNATVAVIADHGHWSTIGRGPLVLFKDISYPDKEFSISNNPVSLDQLHSSIIKRFISDKRMKNDFETLNFNERLVYFPRNVNEFNVYSVDGKMDNEQSWHLKQVLKYTGQNNNFYRIGDIINFGADGNGFEYLGEGWAVRTILSIPNKCGEIGNIHLTLDREARKDLQIDCFMSSWTVKNVKEGLINVYVNDRKIDSWKMKPSASSYTTTIPRKIIGKDNRVKIGFEVNNNEQMWISHLWLSDYETNNYQKF